jgi:hypothetical protein
MLTIVLFPFIIPLNSSQILTIPVITEYILLIRQFRTIHLFISFAELPTFLFIIAICIIEFFSFSFSPPSNFLDFFTILYLLHLLLIIISLLFTVFLQTRSMLFQLVFLLLVSNPYIFIFFRTIFLLDLTHS